MNIVQEITDLIGPASLVQIPKGEKRPMVKEWQTLRLEKMTSEYLSGITPNHNIGVVLGEASGGLVTVDCDSDENLEAFLKANPELAASQISRGKRGGNVWFRIRGEYPKRSCFIKDQHGKDWGEFRSTGGQTVIYGWHPSGCNYTRSDNKAMEVEFLDICWPEGLHLPWMKRTTVPTPPSLAPFEDHWGVLERAQKYIDAIPGAVEGEGGDHQTFMAAKALVNDFGLSVNDALPLMQSYNSRCQPPWEYKDLVRKLNDASHCERSQKGRGELALSSKEKTFSQPGYPSHDQTAEKIRLLVEGLAKSVIPFTSLSLMDLPKRRKILGDWFCEGDLAFLFAERGLGKTWFALAMAIAIACKAKLGPWKVHDRAPVLYVDGEMPVHSLVERVKAMGGDDDLHILSHEMLFHNAELSLNLTDPMVQNQITSICLLKGIKFLFLDNLSCLFSGLRENESDSWEAVLPWLIRLRNHKIAVVIVAHSGRNGLMRGTSRREDAAFSIIRLDHVNDKGVLPIDGARFVSRFTKDRNSRVEQPPYEWGFYTDDEGKVVITYKEGDSLGVFLDWIRQGLDSCQDIAQEMGISKGQVSKLASKAREAGKINIANRRYTLL